MPYVEYVGHGRVHGAPEEFVAHLPGSRKIIFRAEPHYGGRAIHEVESHETAEDLLKKYNRTSGTLLMIVEDVINPGEREAIVAIIEELLKPLQQDIASLSKEVAKLQPKPARRRKASSNGSEED